MGKEGQLSVLGGGDQNPDQDLAFRLAVANDKQAVEELAEQLNHSEKESQRACIRLLLEIGAINPELIAPLAPVFLEFIKESSNPLKSEGMKALALLVFENPSFIYKSLPVILEAAGKGSEKTRTETVHILVQLCQIPVFAAASFAYLLDLLRESSVNQLPRYVERMREILNEDNKGRVLEMLNKRLDEQEEDLKRKQIEQVIKKCNNMKSIKSDE